MNREEAISVINHNMPTESTCTILTKALELAIEDVQKLDELEKCLEELDSITVSSFPKAPNTRIANYQNGYATGIMEAKNRIRKIITGEGE